MHGSWQLQEAKAHLSALIRKATTEGPQSITVRGEEQVMVLSKKDYKKLRKNKPNFFEFMQNSPLKGVKLDLKRDKSLARDISL